MRVLFLLAAALVAVSAAPSPAPKPTPAPTMAPKTCPPRVRKSWDALTSTEKDTFVSAIEVAMDKGLYQKFVWLHQETMSANEAHRTCVFLFWHRKFMLAFENMLRSLGDRYACVTLPYWDYVQDYSTMQNTRDPAQRCNSILSCSAVARELGGSTQGKQSRANFFGYPFPRNTCVTTSPVSHMCVRPGTCEACVPRGNWANTPLIPGMGAASIRPRLFRSGSVVSAMSAQIESSPHDIVHGTLDGVMSNPMTSPADPIFYMHHNMLDLLHTIFY
ncbi:hypothetical protein As57867_007360, partial [Aphanomyces stellatus]